jgi:hypothetical protein
VEFTGYDWLLSRRSVALLLLIPVVTVVVDEPVASIHSL